VGWRKGEVRNGKKRKREKERKKKEKDEEGRASFL
jgi:hypothetical protein